MNEDQSKNTRTTQSSYESKSSTSFSGTGIQNQLDYLKDKIDKYEKRIEDIKDKLDEKIDNSKLKVIETLSIFVALFTFISIDFQVFRSYENPWAIGGLIFILLGSLTMLVILLDYLIINNNPNNKIKKKIQTELWLVNILFLVAGFFLFIISKK